MKPELHRFPPNNKRKSPESGAHSVGEIQEEESVTQPLRSLSWTKNVVAIDVQDLVGYSLCVGARVATGECSSASKLFEIF